MPTILADELKAFAGRLLQAGGFTASDAQQTAELLVWANLRGIESHGVLRIPRYIEMVAERAIVPDSSVSVVHQHGAITVLDGGKGPGAVGMNVAVEQAGQIARQLGVGWCAVRAISHAGAVGYFAASLAQQGLIGIVMSSSKPLMAYAGAKGEAVSTNPIAIAVPAAGADPLILDMSTAAVALGKVMAAKDAGKPIPLGWAIDESGTETTDPSRVAALLPMAGPKGSGLSLMIEILASVLAGNAVIGPVLLGRKKGGFNGLVIAVDPSAFGPRDAFEAAVEDLRTAIHALEPAEGNPAVLLPGERGATCASERSAAGIPIANGTAKRLLDEAARLGVDAPAALKAITDGGR